MSFFKKILKKVNQTLDKPIIYAFRKKQVLNPIHHVQHKRILKRVERMKQIITRLEEMDTKKVKLNALSVIFSRNPLRFTSNESQFKKNVSSILTSSN